MEQVKFNPGYLILKEGDPSDVVYEIVSGEVEIFTEMEQQSVVLGTVKAGEYLGEMGLIENQPRSASARAKSEVNAVVLENAEFVGQMSEDPSSAQRLIHRLSTRLRAANSKLAEAISSQKELEERPEKSEGEIPVGQAVDKLRSDRPRVKFEAALSWLRPFVPKEGIVIQHFPYSVGRVPEPDELRSSVPIDLALPDKPPFRLSRQHFSLFHDSSGYVVYDLGSTLGTEVNGEFLGQHFGKDHATLDLGENIITAGGIDSPFIFKIHLEKE